MVHLLVVPSCPINYINKADERMAEGRGKKRDEYADKR
jgi:hypothetical protein